MKDCQVQTTCLLCNGFLEEVISFGETPLANELLTTIEANSSESEKYQKFDLTLMHCLDCGHCQLKTLVNEDRMYKHYLYVSGTNANNVKHFKDYAESVLKRFYNYNPLNIYDKVLNDNIVEIASNDGTFLKHFPESFNRIGIDPAENLVSIAAKNGITNIPVFFNETTAKNEVSKALNGSKTKVIVANNCFAHNKDLRTIVNGVKEILSEDGTFIIENSYLLDVLNKNLFDIFYAEHIHEFSIKALSKFFDSLDMKLYDVERLSNHGGSFRAYICRKSYNIPIAQSVLDLLELEKTIPEKLKSFKTNVNELKNKMVNLIDSYIKKNKKIGVLGLPAKATTMLYYFGLEKSIHFIYDDNPLKQGMYAPGSNIMIYPTQDISKHNPDVLIVLAWNFADDLINNNSNFKGKFIIPLPEFKVI